MVAVRGVPPGDDRYLPIVTGDGLDFFRCFRDDTVRIPYAGVNDGYCDCQDGSDEPGTEACAGQRETLFYCSNELSLPSYIYASHVNDGVCDCCDGSDEWRGRKTCPNTCEDEGRALRQMHDQRISDLRNGLGQRQTLIEKGRAERNRVHEELAQLRTILPELEASERAVAPPMIENTTFMIVGVCTCIFLTVILLTLWRSSSRKLRLPTAEVLKRIEPLMSILITRKSGEEKLGIGVEEASSGELAITSLDSGGLVDKWNCDQKNEAGRVREGDRIVAVEYVTRKKGGCLRLATSVKDMEAGLMSDEMILTVSAPRSESELQILRGFLGMEGLNLKQDLQLSEVDGGNGGLVVTSLGQTLEDRNARLRSAGVCITQLIEVGDRLIPLESGQYVSLTKFRFPDQVRLDTFEVLLERTSPTDKLGMHLRQDPTNSRMKIMEIVPGGLLEKYLDEAGTDKVLVGDHLLSANGKEMYEEMSEEFRQDRVSLRFGRYVNDELDATDVSNAVFSPKRISRPTQSGRFGFSRWLVLVGVALAVVAVAVACAFEDVPAPGSNEPAGEPYGPAPPAPSINKVAADTETPQVSEYAKWMDGADKPVSKEAPQVSEYAKWMDGTDKTSSENPPTISDQGSGSLTEQTSGDATEKEMKSTVKATVDKSFRWWPHQVKRKLIGIVKYVFSTQPYSAESHGVAKAKLSESRQKEKDLLKKLASSGDDNDDLAAYSSLQGRCISKQVAEYNYEVCFFDAAKQGHTNIGKWKTWEEPHVGLFADGSHCHAGPARSLRVRMRCGSVEEIVDVAEPSRCTYEAVMTHPAACSETRLEAALNASRGPRLPYVEEFW